MPAKYVTPAYHAGAFTCVQCNTLTSMDWGSAGYYNGMWRSEPPFTFCRCTHCNNFSMWSNESKQMVFPASLVAPEAHEDLPNDCQSEFQEAREIYGKSPRGAAAILRLCLQKLLVHLGGKGEHIDTDIKFLVSQGLDSHIQQALDVIRVTGNNAVHPLEMNLEDDQDTVLVLFDMINLIVEERISRPKRIRASFDKLPPRAREAIEKRDKPK